MMDKKYLCYSPEVAAACAEGRPIVALESAILSHGMHYPENMEFSRKLCEVIRSEGAVPATCAIMGGDLKIGLTEEQLERICNGEKIGKAARRDVAIYLATGNTAAVTLATTLTLAEMADIHVVTTSGIVGIHRCDESCAQVSPEVQELTHTSVAVVCAGIKPALDIDMTLSYLRSAGVPIIGLGSDDFPAFYSRKSGFKVDFNAIDAETAAWILHTKWRLGLTGGALIANPMPAEFEPNVNDMEMAIRNALAAAKKSGVRGKSYSDRLNFSSDLELAYNNARVGAQLACEYVKAEEQCLNKE